ncbi:MAG: radical SAM protein, partial [bacterium]|nr:radical SAM protein [bacterium]
RGVRLPRKLGETSAGVEVEPGGARKIKIALIDLNNFSTFPTLAVGILVASLRNAGHEVEVVVPLAYDVPAAERERKERFYEDIQRRIHLSTRRSFRVARDWIRSGRHWWSNRAHSTVLREAKSAIDRGAEIILLSAYLQHYRSVVEIGKIARDRGIPLLLGGPSFNIEATAEAWRGVPGLAALVGGEVDLSLPKIVEAVVANENLLEFPGVLLPGGEKSGTAPPLQKLDRVPVPDFTDFPFDRYRMRVIPVMTGRGCQWNRCVFCNDIVTASGRTFRTRSLESVLYELEEQMRRHDASNFLFLDLKLNSVPAMMRGIAENIRRHVPGAQWVGTVHVDLRKDNGLSHADLRSYVRGGMRRVSFGLESGSQKLLDAMDKGCSVERNGQFIREATEAGLSVRCTMFKGFPGETANDLIATAVFLESHVDFIDRIRFNDFSLLEDTKIMKQVRDEPETIPGLKVIYDDPRRCKTRYVNADSQGRAYRQAKKRVLDVIYKINRREVRRTARAFDGLM